MLKRVLLFTAAVFWLCNASVIVWRAPLAQGRSVQSAVVRLGEQLFRDNRFSTSEGDLPASCSHCHLYDEDPQGLRAYADFFNRSWVSSRSQDVRRLELRNSPTILDVGEMPRLHYDGEFASLEDLVKGTWAGRPMGWLPGEEAKAYAQTHKVLTQDAAYRTQFKAAFDVDVLTLSRENTINLAAKAVAEFMRTLKSRRTSPYDQFVRANGLPEAPATGESAPAFAQKLLAQLSARESRQELKLMPGFDSLALQGLKAFLSTANCAVCHVPPLFTDQSYHNLGISQREYDQIHGAGKFAALSIPGATEAKRPSRQFREFPTRKNPSDVDLGHWNFVDLKTSPLRRAGESDERFLQRMIGTFKTPTLRNLNYSQPYLHDGSLHTFEDLLHEFKRLSELARAGQIREGDDELARINIAESDVAPLAAFLQSLNEDLKKYR